MTAATPGQAFRDALRERWVARGRYVDTRDYASLPQEDRDDLEFATQVAIDHYNDNRTNWPDEGDLAEIATRAAEQAAPELATLLADWRKTVDSLKDRRGVGDARERNTLEVVIGQVEAVLARPPQPAPKPHRHAFAASDCACDPSCECRQPKAREGS